MTNECVNCDEKEDPLHYLQYCNDYGIHICDNCYDKLAGGYNWKFCPNCAGGTIYKQ